MTGNRLYTSGDDITEDVVMSESLTPAKNADDFGGGGGGVWGSKGLLAWKPLHGCFDLWILAGKGGGTSLESCTCLNFDLLAGTGSNRSGWPSSVETIFETNGRVSAKFINASSSGLEDPVLELIDSGAVLASLSFSEYMDGTKLKVVEGESGVGVGGSGLNTRGLLSEGGLNVNLSLPLLLVSNAVLGVCGIPIAVDLLT